MNAFIVSLCISILLAVARGELFVKDEYRLRKYVEDCLAETGLNISILGITKIDELRQESFRSLENLVEEARNCFAACVFQLAGVITLNSTLADHLPSPSINKTFSSSFEDAINACRAEKKICKLGGCLYSVYF